MDEEMNEHKTSIKKLLAENRMNIDDEVKIVSQSDKEKFKLIVQTKLFDPKDFDVRTVRNKLMVEASYEEKELDDETVVKQSLNYQHELPKDVDPKTIKAFFPIRGYMEIEAPRKKR